MLAPVAARPRKRWPKDAKLAWRDRPEIQRKREGPGQVGFMARRFYLRRLKTVRLPFLEYLRRKKVAKTSQNIRCQRFSRPLTKSLMNTRIHRYRTAWVSDVHLGTRGSNARAFLDFLKAHQFETLYLVGALIDIWSLRRGIYWPQEHNDVIQKILRQARKGTRVIYIPGESRRVPRPPSRRLWRDHDPETRHSFDRRRPPHPRPARARARHRGAKRPVAGVVRRPWLPISPRAQSGREFRSPDFRVRLLVAEQGG